MVLELSRRIERHARITTRFARCALSSALHDIRWDRHCRIDHLSPHSALARPANFACHTMGIERQRLRLLPNLEVLEIAHHLMMNAGSPEFETGRLPGGPFHCRCF